MITWGGLVLSNQPFDDLRLIASNLEKWGFSSFWYPDEKYFRDCYIGLTLAAMNSSTIRLGPCVTNPFSQHPIQIAASIGSLAEIAPQRVVLGIGAGGRGLSEIGIQQNRPAVALRETVDIVKRLLLGEKVNYLGQIFKLENLPLDFSTPHKIPIMIATGHGPYVQMLAGEVADIVMLANYCSTGTIIKGLKQVEKGAKKAKRSFGQFELIGRFDIAISENSLLARKAVTPRILSILRSSYPNLNYLENLPDFDISAHLINALKIKDHKTKTFYSNQENSARIIPDVLIDNFAIAGTPDEVADKLNEIIQLGIFNEITISPSLIQDQTMIEAFELFSKKVIPKIRDNN